MGDSGVILYCQHIMMVPAPKFGGGTIEVLLAGKIRLICKRQYPAKN